MKTEIQLSQVKNKITGRYTLSYNNNIIDIFIVFSAKGGRSAQLADKEMHPSEKMMLEKYAKQQKSNRDKSMRKKHNFQSMKPGFIT